MVQVNAVKTRPDGLVHSVLVYFAKLNALVFKWTNGRFMNSVDGRPICLVTMLGAKSNQKRDIPLMFIPYNAGVILVASSGGSDHHPAWYYNLLHSPQIIVRAQGECLLLKARLINSSERQLVWPVCIDHYPRYQAYQQKTHREIPLFVCEPLTLSA